MNYRLLVLLALLPIATTYAEEKLDLRAMFHDSIPPSPFSEVFYGYADAMLQHGRDVYGPQKTGLFLSALDRKTLAPLETRPPSPAGVATEQRPGTAAGPLQGASPQLDQNLYRFLYFLRGLSGEDRYPQAADRALKWFLDNAASKTTGLAHWGKHLCWDVMNDRVISGLPEPAHEFSRPWLLWERCFEIAPEASTRLTRAWCTSKVSGGGGSNTTVKSQPRSARPTTFITENPRQTGFLLRTWAEADHHSGDALFLKAVDRLLTVHEKRLHHEIGREVSSTSASSLLSLAIDCDGAARKIPAPLQTRLTRLAARIDELFCSLPHDLENHQGFVTDMVPADTQRTYTTLWDPSRGGETTAKVAVMVMSRYENTGKVAYRDAIIDGAKAYLDSLPGEDIDAWPMTFGHVITLEMAAFRVTADEIYFKRAFQLGELAIKNFFGDSALPRASLKSTHYESTTGPDTLVLALTELHLLTRTITIVRTPANTIDR